MPVHEGPILLFDGVCNLCNSAVQFVIAHDKKSRFRFASLQSQAAQKMLLDAGSSLELPDSVVLIDDQGVHTRSDAVLRTALKLGWPWVLFAVARLIPRLFRDQIYDWVANHRYRYFGKQETCLTPKPELRERFLDQEEFPIPASDCGGGGRPEKTQTSRLGLGTLPNRFFILYTLLFVLPFPFTLVGSFANLPLIRNTEFYRLPGLAISYYTKVNELMIAVLGRVLLDRQVAFQFTGSGDGRAAYLGVLLNTGIAGTVALVWWLSQRSRPIPNLVQDLSRVLLRYYLAMTMIGYGLSKVFPLQFPAPLPSKLMQPYGEASPMGLLWTFMGASTGYQMFAGAAELLGALLLFSRRTTLLGALILTAVMTNVFMLNMFYDVPVKLYSFHYLVFALALALPDLPRLFGMLFANIPVAAKSFRPFWVDVPNVKRFIGPAKVAIILLVLLPAILSRVDRFEERQALLSEPLRGVYRVAGFQFDSLPDGESEASHQDQEAKWVLVGIDASGGGMIRRANGEQSFCSLNINHETGMLTVNGSKFQFERTEKGDLLLDGSLGGQPIEIVLEYEESLLTHRGFRWISEYPFNR